MCKEVFVHKVVFLKQTILPSARVGITTVVICHMFKNTDLKSLACENCNVSFCFKKLYKKHRKWKLHVSDGSVTWATQPTFLFFPYFVSDFPLSYGMDYKKICSEVGFELILALGKGSRYGTTHCWAGIEKSFLNRDISRMINFTKSSKVSCGSSVREKMVRQMVMLACEDTCIMSQ